MREGKALIEIVSSEVGEAAQQLWVSGEAREQNGRIRLAYRERVTEEMDAESILLPQSRREAIQAASDSNFIKELIPEGLLKCYIV